MLYYLFDYLHECGVPGAGVFQYISFRAAAAIVVSLFISMVVGKRIIRVLARKQIGETVRDLGLAGQKEKEGTPTMGGLIIIAAILIPVLLLCRLDNIYVLLMILTTVWLGTMGFLDDYIKVFKHDKHGLQGKFKVFGQVGLGLVVGLVMCFHPDIVVSQKNNDVIVEEHNLLQNTEYQKAVASFENNIFPVFESADGRYVIPITGQGLWGPVWGYMAFEHDLNTVSGIILDHKGETPGLGAEISTPAHQALYKGKQIFEGDQFVSIKLKKGGATPGNLHEVDAISGGTKTSDGVSAMLYSSLEHYLPWMAKQKASASDQVAVTAPAAEQESNDQNLESNE